MFSFTKDVLDGSKAPLFSILVADGIESRTNNFRIKGSGYQLKLVNRLDEALKAVENPPPSPGKWDVVFLSGFLGSWKENVANLTTSLVKAHKEKRLRTVIMTGLIDAEMEEMVRNLKKAGVPAAWIPYNYDEPSKHVRKAVKL